MLYLKRTAVSAAVLLIPFLFYSAHASAHADITPPRPDNQVLYLAFDEGEGRTVNDLGGRENHGRIVGEPVWDVLGWPEDVLEGIWTEGVKGHAMRFDGKSYYLEAENRYDNLEELTVSFWIWQPESGEPALHILGNARHYHGIRNPGFRFLKRGDNPGDIQLRMSERDVMQWRPRSQNLPVEEWAHIAGVFRGGESQEIYINGKLDGEHETEVKSTAESGAPFTIGINPAGQKCVPGMKIDELRIWDAALSPEEIEELYRAYGH